MKKQIADFVVLAFMSYMVVLATSFMLSSGSALSGQRRTHGAKTMANELGDMRLCASTLHTLQENSLDISMQFFIAHTVYIIQVATQPLNQ